VSLTYVFCADRHGNLRLVREGQSGHGSSTRCCPAPAERQHGKIRLDASREVDTTRCSLQPHANPLFPTSPCNDIFRGRRCALLPADPSSHACSKKAHACRVCASSHHPHHHARLSKGTHVSLFSRGGKAARRRRRVHVMVQHVQGHTRGREEAAKLEFTRKLWWDKRLSSV
jgi:hypothetical protein